MAERECYARCRFEDRGIEYIAGLELRDSDDYYELAGRLRIEVGTQTGQLDTYLGSARALAHDNYQLAAKQIEERLTARWPDRAYFIEVGKEDEWIQLFQPYGVPRGQT